MEYLKEKQEIKQLNKYYKVKYYGKTVYIFLTNIKSKMMHGYQIHKSDLTPVLSYAGNKIYYTFYKNDILQELKEDEYGK